MQLTEVLGRMRGDEIQLHHNPITEWRCNPHTEVKLLITLFQCFVLLCSVSRFHPSLTIMTAVYTHSGTYCMLLSLALLNAAVNCRT